MSWIVEHKKIVLFALAAGLLILAEYYYFIAELRSETADLREQQYKMRADIENNVKKGRFLSERSLTNAQEEIKFLGNRTAALRARINFKPLPGYEIPAMQRPDELIVNFQSLLKETQNRMERTAAQKGIPIPAKLEFPLSKTSPEAIKIYYERLDMLEQMVALAMESNCLKILDWGVSENDFRDFREFKTLSFKSAAGEKNLILIKINGTFESISRFISRLRGAERFICLEKMALNSAGPDLDNITAAFVVASLKLEEAK